MEGTSQCISCGGCEQERWGVQERQGGGQLHPGAPACASMGRGQEACLPVLRVSSGLSRAGEAPRGRPRWEARAGSRAPSLALTCLAAAACIQVAVSAQEEAVAVGPTVIQTGHQVQGGVHEDSLLTLPARKGLWVGGCSLRAGPQ